MSEKNSKLLTFTDETDSLFDSATTDVNFYRQLFSLNHLAIELANCRDMDDIYRHAVEFGHNELELDRIGILLIDHETNEMLGTWGVGTDGNLRNEHEFRAPIQTNILEIIEEFSTKGKVCVWVDSELYEFAEEEKAVREVGTGWNAAIAFWEGDKVVGWVACDNLINKAPFKSYQNHILRLFGTLIGELILRKRAELELNQLNENLEDKVSQRTIELEKAKIQAESSTKAKSLILQNLSHELKTPINSIQGRLHLLEQESLDASVKSHLSQIHSASQILSNQVDTLLHYSDIERNLGIVNVDKIAIDEVIETAIDGLRERARDKRIQLRTYFTPGTPFYVYSDLEKLSLIIQHLVDNAVKFSEKGTIELNFHWQEKSEPTLSIKISDQGIGISELGLESIFDSFVQLDSDNARQYEGVGMGLSLVKKLVTLLGGKISCESEIGVGSTFSVSLPIQANTEVIEKPNIVALIHDVPAWCQSLLIRAQIDTREFINFGEIIETDLVNVDVVLSATSNLSLPIVKPQLLICENPSKCRRFASDNNEQGGIIDPSFSSTKLLRVIQELRGISKANQETNVKAKALPMTTEQVNKALSDLEFALHDYDLDAVNLVSRILESGSEELAVQKINQLQNIALKLESYDFDAALEILD